MIYIVFWELAIVWSSGGCCYCTDAAVIILPFVILAVVQMKPQGFTSADLFH